jgi:NCS2 family nucleobase:cation symporter-2
MDSGISAGCLTAIALNLLFNHLPSKRAEPVGRVASPAAAVAAPDTRPDSDLEDDTETAKRPS